jgi:hypothetical protein
METVLVAEIYFPLEKLSVLFTPWLNQLNSEEHGEREESAVVYAGYLDHPFWKWALEEQIIKTLLPPLFASELAPVGWRRWPMK